MESRQVELEIKLSYAEDLLDELNRVVYRQQARIESLEERVRLLARLVDEMTPPERRAPVDEIPPHY
jgi:SlyX protein